MHNPRLSEDFSNRPVFGRHETFHLRYSWLTKGTQALESKSTIFDSDEATVELGVGKNMVKSIRYWLFAAQLAQESNGRGQELTKLGKNIFSENGKDPYLENNNTIWLLHWLIASDPNHSTTWYWFFNYFHKQEFTSDELLTSLKDFVSEKQWKVSASTLKQDINVLLRMYTETKSNTKVPIEEALDSPMAILGLIKKMPHGRKYRTDSANMRPLSDYVVGYALAEIFEAVDAPALTRETILTGSYWLPGIASVFRMNEAGVEAIIERLVNTSDGRWEFRDTAGVSQLFQTRKISKNEFLEKIYNKKLTGAIA